MSRHACPIALRNNAESDGLTISHLKSRKTSSANASGPSSFKRRRSSATGASSHSFQIPFRFPISSKFESCFHYMIYMMTTRVIRGIGLRILEAGHERTPRGFKFPSTFLFRLFSYPFSFSLLLLTLAFPLNSMRYDNLKMIGYYNSLGNFLRGSKRRRGAKRHQVVGGFRKIRALDPFQIRRARGCVTSPFLLLSPLYFISASFVGSLRGVRTYLVSEGSCAGRIRKIPEFRGPLKLPKA